LLNAIEVPTYKTTVWDTVGDFVKTASPLNVQTDGRVINCMLADADLLCVGAPAPPGGAASASWRRAAPLEALVSLAAALAASSALNSL
jgi:hypothetical protein